MYFICVRQAVNNNNYLEFNHIIIISSCSCKKTRGLSNLNISSSWSVEYNIFTSQRTTWFLTVLLKEEMFDSVMEYYALSSVETPLSSRERIV